MVYRINLTVCILYLLSIIEGVNCTQLLTIQDPEPVESNIPKPIPLLRRARDTSSDATASSRNSLNQMTEAKNANPGSFSGIQVALTKSSFIFNLPLSAQKLLTPEAIHSHLTQYLNQNLKTSFSFSSSVIEGFYWFGKVDLSIELKDIIPKNRRYLSHGNRKAMEENNRNTTDSTLSNITAIMYGEATFLTKQIPATRIMNQMLMKSLGPNSDLLNSFAKSDDDAISEIIAYSYSIDKSPQSNVTIQDPNINGQPQSSSVEHEESNVRFVFVVSVIAGALVVGIIVGFIILILRITNKREVKDISNKDCDISKDDRQESIAGLSVEESCGRSSAYFYDHRHISLNSPTMNDESFCSNRGAPHGFTLNTYDDSFTKSLSLYDPRRLEMIVGLSQKVAGGQSVGSSSRTKGPVANKSRR